jgi:hypothetical protein
LDAVIFKLPEEVFKVPGCCIKEPFVQGGAMLVPGTAKSTLTTNLSQSLTTSALRMETMCSSSKLKSFQLLHGVRI